jgi:N6-adenosine-specific RNA methylase IME4/ParB-like chromosome segregation protein Spo0J
MKTIKEVPIDQIHVGERYRRDVGDIDSLARSIGEIGLLHPIVIQDGKLIVGQRRLEAHRTLGRPTVPAIEINGFEDLLPLLKAERDENMCRKDFAPSEAVALGRRIEPMERMEAKDRQATQARINQPQSDSEVGKLPTSEKGRARDKVGQAVGMSRRTYEKAEAVVEAAEQNPAKFSELQEEMDRTGSVDKAYRKLRQEQVRAERQSPPALTGTPERFIVLLADPPWRYEHTESESRAIENQYPTMSLDEICELPIQDVCTEDVILFLWATSPKLAEAMQVLEAWGFTYRTCAVWDKEKIGMGYYFRQQHELLLVAAKGHPPTPAPSDRVSSVVRSPRLKHSQKPEVVYEIIEAMYPNLPKLELFARNNRDNWSAWGNEHVGEPV